MLQLQQPWVSCLYSMLKLRALQPRTSHLESPLSILSFADRPLDITRLIALNLSLTMAVVVVDVPATTADRRVICLESAPSLG